MNEDKAIKQVSEIYKASYSRHPEVERVYVLVDEEIEYAKHWDRDRVGTPSVPDKDKSVGEWLSFIEPYMRQAFDANLKIDKQEALEKIRAIAGFCVNCMVYHYDELVKKE